MRAGVLASSTALLVSTLCPTRLISSFELENPDHNLGIGCPVPSFAFRRSTASRGLLIVRCFSACSDDGIPLVESRKFPL